MTRPGVMLAVIVVFVVLGVAVGYGQVDPADTPPVVLIEGTTGQQGWRLEGRRLGGDPCVSLALAGQDRPAAQGCGIRRTEQRHLDPIVASVGERVLVFSPLPARARRVRFDSADGTIRMLPADRAAGFPARFFLTDMAPGDEPSAVRVFADHGRSVIA